VELLGELCKGAEIELFVLPPYEIEGELVSSTGIRELLKRGEKERAEKLLGIA
jgi:riboflavin kinase/FMN adenylyltransferase